MALKLSVIIVNYNVKYYLDQCISSVYNIMYARTLYYIWLLSQNFSIRDNLSDFLAISAQSYIHIHIR
jgi:GT2 family glycosyltransferase